jgi:hypothetical protein
MKYFIILLVAFALFSQSEVEGHDGVIITGNIKNCSGDFIILSHIPRMRGNLNYDGFKSIGSPVSAEGHFVLESKTVVNGGLFLLEIADKGTIIDVLAGDSIYLEFDLDDLDQSLFATGRGAGKINLLRLEEFEDIQFKDYDNIESLKAQMDKEQTSQLAILNAVHNGDVNSPIVAASKNRLAILKIMTQTPLSNEEFEFLKEQILIRKFSIASFLKADGESIGLDSLTNVHPYLKEVFTDKKYAHITNMNHPFVAGALDAILEVEFARHFLSSNDQITHHDFSLVRRNHQYYKWIPDYIKENFSQDIFEKWLADQISMSMSMGRAYDEKYEQFKEQCSLAKYRDRLASFHNLLTEGLRDPEFQLDDPDLTLDKVKFDALLESYHGQPVYIVFWSAEYAGSSIINHLPLIKSLEDMYDNQFKVIHICIDKKEKKHLWAARIIDNQWHGVHYFMPMEENERTLTNFGNERISSFCYGGATYSFISVDGEIHKNFEPPLQLKKYVIRKVLN